MDHSSTCCSLSRTVFTGLSGDRTVWTTARDLHVLASGLSCGHHPWGPGEGASQPRGSPQPTCGLSQPRPPSRSIAGPPSSARPAALGPSRGGRHVRATQTMAWEVLGQPGPSGPAAMFELHRGLQCFLRTQAQDVPLEPSPHGRPCWGGANQCGLVLGCPSLSALSLPYRGGPTALIGSASGPEFPCLGQVGTTWLPRTSSLRG